MSPNTNPAMSSSSLPNTTESDEALARALQDTENAAAVAAAAYDDGYDALPRDALLRELRIRDQELVTAVTEVQLLRANVSKAEELGCVAWAGHGGWRGMLTDLSGPRWVDEMG